jgi:hypothetical protein
MIEPDRSEIEIKYGTCVLHCWITEATHTHSEYVIIVVFPRQNIYANAPQFYVIRTSTLLFPL